MYGLMVIGEVVIIPKLKRAMVQNLLILMKYSITMVGVGLNNMLKLIVIIGVIGEEEEEY